MIRQELELTILIPQMKPYVHLLRTDTPETKENGVQTGTEESHYHKYHKFLVKITKCAVYILSQVQCNFNI